MTRKQKKMLWRIIAAAALFVIVLLIPDQIYPADRWVIDFTGRWTPPADWIATGYVCYSWGLYGLLFYLIPYFVIGWDVEGRPQHRPRPGL